MHSDYLGTEHRPQFVGTMTALPAWQTPTQEVMDLPPASPDWHDHREVIEGTMRSRPVEAHRVYAGGRVIATIPAPVPNALAQANAIAEVYRQRAQILGENPAEVTVDAWCPGDTLTDAHTTRTSTHDLPSVYRESTAALMGMTVDELDALEGR